MNFVRSSGCLLGLLMMSNGISVAAVFAPNDRIVTDPAQSVRDPEFDRTENLMVWQDELNQLWLADIDPDTGDISPFNGKGQLIDTALSNLAAVGNGPEFGYGNGETILCYTRTLSSTRVLSTASKDELGNWVPALEDLGANRYRPICSPEGTADPARMIYVQDVAPGESVVNWRVVGNYATERSFPGLSGVGGRWAATKNAFVSAAKVNNVWQLFWTDIDLETSEQITFEASAKFNAFAWYAPEFDDVLISAAVDFMNVGIYRRIGGVWTRIYTFKVPSTFQFVSSPEPFVHNGKSFIAVIAASQLRSTPPLPYIPNGPSEVWIANIDPAQPFFRRIDNGQSGPMRLEPEPVALATGAVLYFTEQDPLTEKSVTRIAKTGLGSPAAGDSDGDAVSDDADNCTAVINADQVDADKDGIGNRCDADVNNDCIVNNTDLGIIRSNFTTGLPSADINVNGVVDWTDFSLARQQLTKAPGPAAVPNVCQAQ